MGNSSSITKFEQSLGSQIPPSERYFGLENFGNTCYCNSVLQVLFYCLPFREKILEHANETELRKRQGDGPPKKPEPENSILPSLCRLFWVVTHQKDRSGIYSPKEFISSLRQQNVLFRPFIQQDAHEFLIYLLNDISEALVRRKNQEAKESNPKQKPEASEPPKTFVHDLFQGILVNETKCMCCEAITTKDETFFDLSVEIEPNVSLLRCLRKFSETEMLSRQNKFYCEQCRSLQEAQKRMKVKKLPTVLIIHLKRFKYIEQINQMAKLSYRVVFPFELRLNSVLEQTDDDGVIYELSSVVVHVGSGPSQGHYISAIKSYNQWLVFDDQDMEVVSEPNIQTCFGSTASPPSGSVSCGYLLIYSLAKQEIKLS